MDCKFDQIDLVGAKLQTVIDLMTGNAILFHSGGDPFTPGGLGVFFGKFPKLSKRKRKSILYNLGAHSYLSYGTYDE